MTSASLAGETAGGKRILFVNRVSFLGGAERVLLTIANSIGSAGYTPLLLCPDGGQLAAIARERGIQVEGATLNRMRISSNPITLASYPIAWWRGSRHLVRFAAASRASLIHVHHPVTALYSAWAAHALGLPVILHMHDAIEMNPLYKLALWNAVRLSDHIICVSNTSRKLIEAVGADPAKISVVFSGLDPTIVNAVHAPATEVSGPGPHIGIFGVVHPVKGHDVFLAAARLLAQRHPTAHFWIVGPETYEDKTEYYRDIRALANDTPLAGRVTFAGFRRDVARWMAAMDVVAMPSIGTELVWSGCRRGDGAWPASCC